VLAVSTGRFDIQILGPGFFESPIMMSVFRVGV
jgi:hypothetical protein